MVEVAKNFWNYMTSSSSAQQVNQPPLKCYEVWANCDKMTENFDDEDMVDLNIKLMNMIGNAVKEQRKKKKSTE